MKIKQTFKYILATVIFLVITLTLTILNNRTQTVTRNVFAMGTLFEITVNHHQPQPALDAAVAEIQRLEKLFDASPQSDLSRINNAAGKQQVTVAPETLQLLELTSQLYHVLLGSFDPTIAPLIELWGFSASNRQPQLPEATAIAKTKTLVDFTNVQIDFENSTVFLPQPGMKLDLGGIAKGFTVDQVCYVLQKHGVKSALINGGSSSIRVIGKKSLFTKWRLGISHPRNSGSLLGVATLPNNRALGTSADTQNYFIKDNLRYSHLIDPRTGYPTQDKIQVTIIAPTAVEADLLSTACFILPLDKIQTLLITRPNLEVIIFTDAEKTLILNGKHFTPIN